MHLYTLVTSDWLTGGRIKVLSIKVKQVLKIRQESGDLCVGPLRRILEPNLNKCCSQNCQSGFDDRNIIKILHICSVFSWLVAVSHLGTTALTE